MVIDSVKTQNALDSATQQPLETQFAQFSLRLYEPPRSDHDLAHFLTRECALMLQCLCLQCTQLFYVLTPFKNPDLILAHVILLKIMQLLTPIEFLKHV